MKTTEEVSRESGVERGGKRVSKMYHDVVELYHDFVVVRRSEEVARESGVEHGKEKSVENAP